MPLVAAWAATSSSKVDLPTPGSPANSTTTPGTKPPPSTRSSSPTPVGRARAASASIAAIGRAGQVTGPDRTVCKRGGPAPPICSTVPHAWHSPHRPAHLADCQPHSPHRYAEPSRRSRITNFVTSERLRVRTDKFGDAQGRSPARPNRLSPARRGSAPTRSLFTVRVRVYGRTNPRPGPSAAAGPASLESPMAVSDSGRAPGGRHGGFMTHITAAAPASACGARPASLATPALLWPEER